jgi:plastocyanin
MMRKLSLAVAVATWLIASALPSTAAVTVILATTGDRTVNSYTTPVVIAPVGGPLTFVNGDVQPHNVVSDQTGPGTQPWCGFFPSGACPVFWSPFPQAGLGQAAVQGTENLVAGTVYSFHCFIHTNMTGTLIAV